MILVVRSRRVCTLRDWVCVQNSLSVVIVPEIKSLCNVWRIFKLSSEQSALKTSSSELWESRRPLFFLHWVTPRLSAMACRNYLVCNCNFYLLVFYAISDLRKFPLMDDHACEPEICQSGESISRSAILDYFHVF